MKSYETQPIGIPEVETGLLDMDDIDAVRDALYAAVCDWDKEPDAEACYEAYEYLADLLSALGIMTRATLAYMQPIHQAHQDDHRAAEEWKAARWRARTQT